MSETPTPIKAHPEPELYEIRVRGHLDARWANRFEGLTITLEENGDTLLTGPVIDQAALHGLLKKVRDLGLPLVSVVQVQFHETHQYHSKKGVIKMNTNIKTTGKIDTKVLLSTLWIVVMINMLKADILSLFIPGVTDELAKFSASAGASIPQLMLIGAMMGRSRHCHDHSIPRVEVRNQSLGQYHRGYRHHCLYLGRHVVISSLHLHRQRRDPLSVC